MESTIVIQQEPFAQQESREAGRLKRLLSNFLGGSLSALAVYVFLVALPFWVLGSEAFYAFIDKLDPFALTVVVIVGLVIAIRCESKKISQADVERYHLWMKRIIRYSLAYIFLIYGFAKVFHNQFFSLPSTLDTPVGEISGLQLTWRFFGYSYAYTLFVASSQILSSLLLFFRRTTTLAAVILLPVISNIVFVNFTHHIPVKLYSSFYLMMALYLLLLDYRKLKAVFWDQQGFPNAAAPVFSKSKWQRLAKPLLIVVLVFGAVGDGYYELLLDQKLKSPLQGVWEVEEYRVNDVPVEYNSEKTVWRKVYFDYTDLAAVRTDRAKPLYVIPVIDTENRTISFTDRKTEEIFVEGSYELPSPERLIMQVSQGADKISVTLNRLK
jgi:uncharacterized membrane protein YphA (DoxX/SURF4 family)